MTSKLNVLTDQCRAAVSKVRPPQLAASLVDQFLSTTRAPCRSVILSFRPSPACCSIGARRKEVPNLAARISEAQKSIAAARSAAMANIQSIAKETAGGIVERLTGVTPSNKSPALDAGGAWSLGIRIPTQRVSLVRPLYDTQGLPGAYPAR